MPPQSRLDRLGEYVIEGPYTAEQVDEYLTNVLGSACTKNLRSAAWAQRVQVYTCYGYTHCGYILATAVLTVAICLYGRGSSSSAHCCTTARCLYNSRSLCTRRASPCSLGPCRTRLCPSSCLHCSYSSTSTPMTSYCSSCPPASHSILCRSLLASSSSALAHPTCATVHTFYTRRLHLCQSQLRQS